MKSKLIVAALIAALMAGVLAPAVAGRASAAVPAAPTAGSMQSHSAFLDKTRFLAHVGLAYFAFHHWVYTPYKKGAFASGASGRVKAIVKAGIATLFAYHELKVAYGIAQKSSSKTLHAIIAPLNALIGEADKVGTNLKSGHYNPADIVRLNKSVDSFGSLADHNGYTIKDIPVTIPGT